MNSERRKERLILILNEIEIIKRSCRKLKMTCAPAFLKNMRYLKVGAQHFFEFLSKNQKYIRRIRRITWIGLDRIGFEKDMDSSSVFDTLYKSSRYHFHGFLSSFSSVLKDVFHSVLEDVFPLFFEGE